MPIYAPKPDRAIEVYLLSLRRRALFALGFLVFTVALSTIGFVVLDRDPTGSTADRLFAGFWDTLNLVSTVGSLHQDLSTAQQAWALLVITFGLGAVLYGFSTLQGMLHGGDVGRLYARRRMKHTLDELRDHVIVCGYGRVGREVARVVRKATRDLVVIEGDEARSAQASEEGFLVVHADATLDETLRAAQVERASALVAALDKDASNVFLILVARALQPGLRIAARANRPESKDTLLRAGADDVTVPGELAGRQLSHLIVKPQVVEFVTAAFGEGEFDFAELHLADHPRLSGKTLGDLDLPGTAEAIVIAVVHGDGRQTFNPNGSQVLRPDDTLIIVCREGGLDRIAAIV